jgi:hypothetical protein
VFRCPGMRKDLLPRTFVIRKLPDGQVHISRSHFFIIAQMVTVCVMGWVGIGYLLGNKPLAFKVTAGLAVLCLGGLATAFESIDFLFDPRHQFVGVSSGSGR